MSQRSKITIAIMVGVALVCIAGCLLGYFGLQAAGKAITSAFNTDPAQAAEVGHEIIDYQLPYGYQEQMSMNMLIMKMVFIGSGNSSAGSNSMMLAIAELPMSSDYSETQMRQQIQGQMQNSMSTSNIQLTLLETRTFSIAGQNTDLYIYQGSNSQTGAVIREAFTGVFTGKKGKVMIMIFGSEYSWDQNAVDAFLQSITT